MANGDQPIGLLLAKAYAIFAIAKVSLEQSLSRLDRQLRTGGQAHRQHRLRVGRQFLHQATAPDRLIDSVRCKTEVLKFHLKRIFCRRSNRSSSLCSTATDAVLSLDCLFYLGNFNNNSRICSWTSDVARTTSSLRIAK